MNSNTSTGSAWIGRNRRNYVLAVIVLVAIVVGIALLRTVIEALLIGLMLAIGYLEFILIQLPFFEFTLSDEGITVFSGRQELVILEWSSIRTIGVFEKGVNGKSVFISPLESYELSALLGSFSSAEASVKIEREYAFDFVLKKDKCLDRFREYPFLWVGKTITLGSARSIIQLLGDFSKSYAENKESTVPCACYIRENRIRKFSGIESLIRALK